MIIFVRNNLKSIIYNSKDTDSIKNLSTYLEEYYKVKRKKFWLSFEGKILMDEFMIKDYLSPNCTVFINWKPMNIIKIISGKNIFYTEYEMINNMKKVNFKRYIKQGKNHNMEYTIPKKYLNNLIFDNWFDIYKHSKTIRLINFNKFNDKQYIKLLVDKYFYKILKNKSLDELKNLSLLFNFIDNLFYFNVINCFIANKFIKNRPIKYLMQLDLIKKN